MLESVPHRVEGVILRLRFSSYMLTVAVMLSTLQVQ